jgi:hypothetical protein
LSPIPRKVLNYSSLNQRPCGNASKGDIHFVTANGSVSFIAWKVVHPSPTGNCTVRLGQSADDRAFSVLKPIDKVSNKDGAFACGRESAKLETVQVKVPNIACDSCTI